MTSQPQTIIIITSRESSSPAGASKRNRKTQGKKKTQSLSLQLQSTSSTTPPSEPTHLSFSKPHDQQHPNLHQQPNRPSQAQTNDKMQLPTTLLRRSIARPSFLPTITATTTTTRPFSLSPLNQARKDTQDKDSLKPEPTEYSKSGSDDAAAATEKAAFDPSSTRPEEEQNIAGRESGGDVSCLVILVTH